MKRIDYETYWLTEEAPPPPKKRVPRRPPQQQRGTAYLRDCGPHVALYGLAGGCIGFLAPILFGLFAMFLELIF